MTASQPHANAIVFDLFQILFHLQLHEWLEKHFLSILTDANARVDYLHFKDIVFQ